MSSAFSRTTKSSPICLSLIAAPIVDEVSRLDVYQRTAIWLLGKADAEISEGWKRVFRGAPFVQDLVRWMINALVELTMGTGFVRYKKFPWLFRWLEKQLVESIRTTDNNVLVPDVTSGPLVVTSGTRTS